MDKSNTTNKTKKMSTEKKYNVIFMLFAVAIIVSYVAFIPDKNDYVAFNESSLFFFGDDWQLENGTYVLFSERAKEYLENGFDIEDIRQGNFLKGIVSRKKQILPAIMNGE